MTRPSPDGVQITRQQLENAYQWLFNNAENTLQKRRHQVVSEALAGAQGEASRFNQSRRAPLCTLTKNM